MSQSEIDNARYVNHNRSGRETRFSGLGYAIRANHLDWGGGETVDALTGIKKAHVSEGVGGVGVLTVNLTLAETEDVAGLIRDMGWIWNNLA